MKRNQNVGKKIEVLLNDNDGYMECETNRYYSLGYREVTRKNNFFRYGSEKFSLFRMSGGCFSQSESRRESEWLGSLVGTVYVDHGKKGCQVKCEFDEGSHDSLNFSLPYGFLE